MTEPPAAPISLIEVQHRARFQHVVVLHRPGGPDIELPSCRLRWTAARVARREQQREYDRQYELYVAQLIADSVTGRPRTPDPALDRAW